MKMIRLQHPAVTVESGGEKAVVRVTDRVLSEATVQGIHRHLPYLIGASGGRAMHLDMAAVEAPTAGGMGRLVALHHRLRADDRKLVLFNVGSRAHEVLDLVGLTDLLDVRRQ